MKTVLLVCSLILVSGCQWMVRTETVEVDVPVPVPCVNADDVPPEVESAGNQVTRSSPPGEKIEAILIERERLRQNDTEFRALVQGCLL